MAANKYVGLISGKLKEVFGLVVSAGVGDANKLVALDSTGKLDNSVMPIGIGPEVLTIVASEALASGDFVNIFDNAGTINVRKADASTSGKPAHGFVLASVLISGTATVYLISQTNNQLSSLTIGVDYYLSTTPGSLTATPPSASGNVVQFLGRAHSTTALVFVNEQTIEVS
jgi:hypothetical protein